MFDEQPDGDPHGECAAEIHRLQAENAKLRAASGVDAQWVEDARTLREMIRNHQYGLRGFGDGSLSRGRNFTDRERNTIERALAHLSTALTGEKK